MLRDGPPLTSYSPAYSACSQQKQAGQRRQAEDRINAMRHQGELDNQYFQQRQADQRRREQAAITEQFRRFGWTPEVFASFESASAYIDGLPPTAQSLAALNAFISNNTYRRVAPADKSQTEQAVRQNDLYDQANRKIGMIKGRVQHDYVASHTEGLSETGSHPDATFLSRHVALQTVAYGQAVATPYQLGDILRVMNVRGTWQQRSPGWLYILELPATADQEAATMTMMFVPDSQDAVQMTQMTVNGQPLPPTQAYVALRAEFLAIEQMGQRAAAEQSASGN